MKASRITVKVARVKVLKHYTTGYARSGVYPTTHHWFYEVIGEDGKVYVVSTTKELREGYYIIATVVGESVYNGIKQTKLTRVSYTEETINAKVEAWAKGVKAWACAE